ncbi:hypothetical protein [Ferruginibacter sp.]
MKPLFTLAFFLLCTLPGKLGHAYPAGNSFLLNALHIINAEKKQPVLGATATTVQPAAFEEAQDDDLFCIEEDDQDDVNHESTGYHYYLAFYYAFVLSHRQLFDPGFTSFSRPVLYSGSCKYITQRVLRI